jgi:hypothetical protein
MQKISISQLEEIHDSLEINSNEREIIDIILAAINDWPNPIFTLEEYILDVEKFIGFELSKETISTSLLNMDLLKNAWESESLTQIMEIFNFYNTNISLMEIITEIDVKFKKSRS